MPAWATLAVAGLVGMAETGAVIQSAVPGEAFPTSSVFGPGRLTSPVSTGHSALAAWASLAKNQPALSNWLLWHLGFNLLFLVGYFMFAAAALRLLTGLGTTSDRRLTTGWRLLMATGAAHLVLIVAACVCILGWIRPGRDPGTFWAVALQVLDLVTWAAALWLIGWFCYRARDQRAVLRPWAQAAKIQRFSLVIAVVLIVVAILPGTNVLEQIPDVQRAWIGSKGVATAALGAAIGAQILLAIVMFRIGRLRITRARQRSDKFPDVQRSQEVRYRGWFITSAAFLLLAGLLWVSGQARVGLTVAVIPGVLCVVAVISWFANLATRNSGNNPPQPEATDLTTSVSALGDGLAVAVLAIPGLGLVRSFTTPALVGVGAYAWDARAAVLIGIALSALVWPGARWVLKFLTRLNLGSGKTRSWVLLSVSILFYLGALVWLLRWPLQASARLGVVASATIALGALAMILALLAHLAQNREPLPLFRLLRLKTTPVLSILAVIGIIGVGVGQSSALHEITQNPAAHVTSRQPLMQKLAAWLAAPQRDCIPNVTYASDGQAVQVRPLVLVAAAGGGIRAAWWTASALTTLADNECGRQSVFAVSSVSGSSLGTAVVATASGHGSALRMSVATAMDRLAQPSALASGIDGLVLRDTVAGLTGLTVRAAAMPTGPAFPDRAALIQQAWIDADPSLASPFLARPAASLPWQLLFNSTAVRSGCMAIIASAAVGPSVSPAKHTPRCLQISGQPFASSDLPDAYDLFAQLPCLSHISVATAAMLSARFAYVTPSGEVPGCGGPRYSQPTGQLVEQYIDGGYSDSSGLETLRAIMPDLLELIAQHNAAQLVKAGAGPVSLVVPIVAYLANTPIVKPLGPEGLLPEATEPTIPLTAGGAATGQLNGQTVLLQDLAEDIARGQWLPCARGDARCSIAVQALRNFVASEIVVIAPRQEPGAFAVPLGWVLSQASEQSLSSDLATEAVQPCNADGIYCAPGTEGLSYLLGLTRSVRY